MKKYTFDIIIPTYNNLDELKKCLEGLSIQVFRDFRAFICVDGSTDGTIEYLDSAKYNFDFEVLLHPENKNSGRTLTRNLAVPKLNSQYTLYLDSDINASETLLKQHLLELEKGRVVSVGEVEYLDTDNVWAEYIQTRGKNKYAHLSEISSIYLNTQNTALPTEFIKELNGQDPDFSVYYGGDDTVLGIQLEEKYKAKFVFNKLAYSTSYMNKDLSKALNQMKEFGRYNLKLLLEKFPERKDVFNSSLGKSGIIKFIFTKKMTNMFSEYLFKVIKYLPKKIRIYVIHFLVFKSIMQGFYSK